MMSQVLSRWGEGDLDEDKSDEGGKAKRTM